MSNFHLAFFFLSPEKRQAMFDFYEFCRKADDIVDNQSGESSGAVDRARAELDALRTEVEAIFSGRANTLLGLRLAEMCRVYPVRKKEFLDIIRGCEWDLTKKRYTDFKELEQYCYDVASAVGLVSIEIFGYRCQETRDFAISLGKAFQLTNILRDLREDGERGRIYLPQEDFERFHCTEKAFLAGNDDTHLSEMLRFQCDRAENYYRQAEVFLKREDSRSMLAAQIMREVYHEILRRIRSEPAAALRHRIEVPRMQKLTLALSGYLANIVRS